MRACHALSITLILALGGCASPFAQDLGYDTAVRNAPASITISDAKVYSRQGLIDERQKDVNWLNQLIDESATQTFEPEILREVEQISSFAAALGIAFNPAAGLDYRRDKETGDIQQEISALKMQVQLEQLKQDVKLFRESLAMQTLPVNQNLGQATAGPPADSASALPAAAADQLKAAIDRLLPALTGRLDMKDSPLPQKSNSVANPADLFRDRAAYRDLLKSARNAASLDEAHDLAEAVLVRLNFQATVIPDPRYPRSLGVVQIAAEPVEATVSGDFYRQWTAYLNGPIDPGQTAMLAGARFVERHWFELGAGATCRGIVSGPAVAPEPGCSLVELTIPSFAAANGEPISLERAFANTSAVAVVGGRPRFETVRTRLSSPFDPAPLCATIAGTDADPTGQLLLSDLEYVRALSRNAETLVAVYGLLRANLGQALGRSARIPDRLADARRYVEDVANRLPACGADVSAFLEEPVKPLPVAGFSGAAPAIRVYDVGPREQVQQVSTVARSANSLALAANLAASAPGSGAAASAAASYSRQAIGRATARERIPAVVGYAAHQYALLASTTDLVALEHGADSAEPAAVFGWVVGPQAQIEPKGRIHVEQTIRAYDLSVDLSVPRFTSALKLKITPIWGPSPAALAAGALVAKNTVSQELTVPLPIVANDFTAYGRSLLGLAPSLDHTISPVGGPVSGCAAATLYFSGNSPNLWRTRKVLVGTKLIEGQDISVLPDMTGIIVKVASTDYSGPTIPVTLLSPLGAVSAVAPYVAKPAGGCAPAGGSAAAPDDTAKVTGIVPSDATFVLPSEVRLRLTGTKLDQVDEAVLRGHIGKIEARNDKGTAMSVVFTAEQTRSFRTSNLDSVVLTSKGKSPIEIKVMLIRAAGD